MERKYPSAFRTWLLRAVVVFTAVMGIVYLLHEDDATEDVAKNVSPRAVDAFAAAPTVPPHPSGVASPFGESSAQNSDTDTKGAHTDSHIITSESNDTNGERTKAPATADVPDFGVREKSVDQESSVARVDEPIDPKYGACNTIDMYAASLRELREMVAHGICSRALREMVLRKEATPEDVLPILERPGVELKLIERALYSLDDFVRNGHWRVADIERLVAMRGMIDVSSQSFAASAYLALRYYQSSYAETFRQEMLTKDISPDADIVYVLKHGKCPEDNLFVSLCNPQYLTPQ